MYPRAYFFLSLFLLSCGTETNVVPSYDDSAVTGILSLFDSIAVRHPDYEQVWAELQTRPPALRPKTLDSLQALNEADARLQKTIDALLALEPYRIYFARFTNVTSDHYRRAFNALPYSAPDMPGGLADALYDLMHHRQQFGAWYGRARGQIDIRRCIESAARWLPPDYHTPNKVYAIYDGNAGSFAEEGNAFFNLCSEVVTRAAKGERFSNLEQVSIPDLEAVIAHELNHVMTTPLLFPDLSLLMGWEERMTRNIVSEGVAFLCDPPRGFQKEVWEDRETLAALVGELNRTFIAFSRKEISENDVGEWYGSLFQERATAYLARYLKRAYPDSNLMAMVKEHSVFRPDLVHVLGAWMVARVTGKGEKRELAIELLNNPQSLYRKYNATLEPGMQDLAVDPLVVAMMEAE